MAHEDGYYHSNRTPNVSGSENPEDTTETGEFVKIGGDLAQNSDPRRFHVGGSKSRMRKLKWIDAQASHYSIMLLMTLDFLAELCAISFAQFRKITPVFDDINLYLSSFAVIIYCLDMILRIIGLRAALLRSNSAVADLCATVLTLGLVVARHMYPDLNFDIAIVHLIVLAARLILKPRARSFSKKLHKFGKKGATIRIPMDSVRSVLRHIPGVSAVAVEMMETDLLIICGRDHGDMTNDELMQFLERALLYRPRELSATEFLAHLQDIDAQSVRYAYGPADVIRSTLWHWSSQRLDLFFSILVVCTNALVIPVQSHLIGFISNNALTGDEDFRKYSDLATGATGILLLCIPFFLANYGIGYFQSKMIAKATERMQLLLLNTILKQKTEFFSSRSEGDLNNLFASDISRVNALWQSMFWNLLNPLFSVVFGFGFILINDWPTGVVAFTFTAVLLSSGPQGIASQRSKDFGSKNAYVTAEFQNAIACQKVIRSYRIRIPFMKKFSQSIEKLRESSFAKDFWSSIVQIYVEAAMYLFVAIITASLLFKTFDEELSVGTFFAFLTMLSRISTPVTTLGGFMRVAIGNSSSLQRLDDIILGLNENEPETGVTAEAKEDDDENGDNLPPIPGMTKSLTCRNLYYQYDKKSDVYILNNLTFKVQKGSYTCLCGPSGSGKSTVLGCLMQFYEPDCGSIQMDGTDITHYSKSSFMDQVAVVFQEICILNGTILENIRYGNIYATDQECIEAARLAECAFIDDLKYGFNTIIGQHATTSLSGGQAQRICLARAICRKPTVLLLDEATSALDPETEASIIRTLEKLASITQTTIISVTHRLQTTVHADMIYVLHQGGVVEKGTYIDLKEKKGSLFSEMLNVQESQRDPALKKPIRFASSVSGDIHPSVPASRPIPMELPQEENEEHKNLLDEFSQRLQGKAETPTHTPRLVRNVFGFSRHSRTSRHSTTGAGATQAARTDSARLSNAPSSSTGPETPADEDELYKYLVL